MKKRNPIAEQLHSPRYRKRVVAMKTIYDRKKTEKKPRSKTDYEVEDRATRTKSVIPKSKTEVTEDRRIKTDGI